MRSPITRIAAIVGVLALAVSAITALPAPEPAGVSAQAQPTPTATATPTPCANRDGCAPSAPATTPTPRPIPASLQTLDCYAGPGGLAASLAGRNGGFAPACVRHDVAREAPGATVNDPTAPILYVPDGRITRADVTAILRWIVGFADARTALAASDLDWNDDGFVRSNDAQFADLSRFYFGIPSQDTSASVLIVAP